MNNKKELALALWARGSQPVKFVRDSLEGNTLVDMDEPRLRSYYILLSYSFEMILKSAVAVSSKGSDVEKIINEIKNYKHDLKKISDALGDTKTKIGIKDIATGKNSDYFNIKTLEGENIRIEDFTKVRYESLTSVRNVAENEHEKISNSASIILRIAGEVSNMISKPRENDVEQML
jgi:hypothetical protein